MSVVANWKVMVAMMTLYKTGRFLVGLVSELIGLQLFPSNHKLCFKFRKC